MERLAGLGPIAIVFIRQSLYPLWVESINGESRFQEGQATVSEDQSFQIERNNDITIVSLGPNYGSIEGQLVSDTEKKLLEVARNEDCSHLILDMQHTRFFGSSFIEALVRVWNEIKLHEHGSLQICSLQTYCKEILEVTHLDKIWEVCDDREQAVKHCQSSNA